MVVKKMPIEKLKFAPYNPRLMTEEEKEKLKHSITKFGLVEPLVWNKRTGHVVGGNQRLMVLKELGIKEVEVVVVDIPLIQEKALNIALNKISGEWDFDSLSNLLNELNASFDDILAMGYTEEEISFFIHNMDYDYDAVREAVHTGKKTSEDDNDEYEGGWHEVIEEDMQEAQEETAQIATSNPKHPRYIVYVSFPDKDTANAFLASLGVEKEFKQGIFTTHVKWEDISGGDD